MRAAINWRPKTPFYYGWLVLAMTFLGTFAASGVSQAVIGGIQDFIFEDMSWSQTTIALAATAGTWAGGLVSPFIGRLDDIDQPGMEVVADIIEIFSQYPDFRTQVLVASVRNTKHVVEAARLGADVVTLPPNVLRQLFVHPLTEKGLAAFLADWNKTGQSILPPGGKPKAAE